jgi:hypothetical protein
MPNASSLASNKISPHTVSHMAPSLTPEELKEILRRVDEALAEGRRLRAQVETALKASKKGNRSNLIGQPIRTRKTRRKSSQK